MFLLPSPLAERPRNMIVKRLEQVLKRGALVGLNESLNRHARNEAHVLQVRNLRRRPDLMRLLMRMITGDGSADRLIWARSLALFSP